MDRPVYGLLAELAPQMCGQLLPPQSAADPLRWMPVTRSSHRTIFAIGLSLDAYPAHFRHPRSTRSRSLHRRLQPRARRVALPSRVQKLQAAVAQRRNSTVRGRRMRCPRTVREVRRAHPHRPPSRGLARLPLASAVARSSRAAAPAAAAAGARARPRSGLCSFAEVPP